MSTVDKKLQIFISSTSIDLQEERQAAVDAILKTNNIPSAMEYFNSTGPTLDIIKGWIDDSDIFVLILGGRYGGLEKTSQKSYTHLEYEYAIEKKKPIIAIVLNDSFLNEKFKLLGLPASEVDNPHKYRDFKEIVLNSGKHCFICKNLNDIGSKMTNAIYAADKENKLTGWVSGRELESLRKEINRLEKENIELFGKLSLNGYHSITISRDDYKVIEESHYPINPEDIDICLESIKFVVDKFEIHFKVENNSDSYLTTPGRFEYKLEPQVYEDEINQSGYNHTPIVPRQSDFIYPGETFEGYYTYHIARPIEFIEIIYFVYPKGGVKVPIKTWNHEEVEQILANDI